MSDIFDVIVDLTSQIGAKDKRIAELEETVKKLSAGELDLLAELDAKSFVLNNALLTNSELRKRIKGLEELTAQGDALIQLWKKKALDIGARVEKWREVLEQVLGVHPREELFPPPL